MNYKNLLIVSAIFLLLSCEKTDNISPTLIGTWTNHNNQILQFNNDYTYKVETYDTINLAIEMPAWIGQFYGHYPTYNYQGETYHITGVYQHCILSGSWKQQNDTVELLSHSRIQLESFIDLSTDLFAKNKVATIQAFFPKYNTGNRMLGNEYGYRWTDNPNDRDTTITRPVLGANSTDSITMTIKYLYFELNGNLYVAETPANTQCVIDKISDRSLIFRLDNDFEFSEYHRQ